MGSDYSVHTPKRQRWGKYIGQHIDIKNVTLYQFDTVLQKKTLTLRAIHTEARRQRIIEAARKLIAAGGLPALSMRKLGSEAGVSVTTLYNLFGNSDGILNALIDDAVDRVDEVLKREPPRENPLEQCHTVITVSVRCMVADEAIYRPLGIAGYERLARAGAEERRLSDRAAAIVRVAVEQAIAQGQLTDQLDPHHLAQQIYATWDRAFSHWAFGLIHEDEFRARALYGMSTVLLGVATDTVRPQLIDQLHELEQTLGQLGEKTQKQSQEG